jgi:hypothetical protein
MVTQTNYLRNILPVGKKKVTWDDLYNQDITEPIEYDPDYLDLGIPMEKGWKLKVHPAATGIMPEFSFIDDTGQEFIKSNPQSYDPGNMPTNIMETEDFINNPIKEGQHNFTKQDIEDFYGEATTSPQGQGSALNQPGIDNYRPPIPDVSGMSDLVESYRGIMPGAMDDPDSVIKHAINPEWDTAMFNQVVNDNPDWLENKLKEQGRNPYTESLIRMVVPDITEDEINLVFPLTYLGNKQVGIGPAPIGTPTKAQAEEAFLKSRQLEPYQTQGKRIPVLDDIIEWGMKLTGKVATSKAGGSFVAGIGDVFQTVGGAASWLGHKELGDTLAQGGTEFQWFAPPDTTGGAAFNPMYDLGNPDWYLTKGIRAVPFSLSLVPMSIAGYMGGGELAAAMGLGKIGTMIVSGLAGGALSRPMESAMEAGSTYNDVIARGGSEGEAKKAANQVFTDNLKLTGMDAAEIAIALAPTQAWVPKALVTRGLARTAMVGGKMVVVGLTQGGEEAVQEYFQRKAKGEEFKLDAVTAEAIALGAVMGIGMGLSGDIMSGVVNKTKEILSPEQKKSFQAKVYQYTDAGYGDQLSQAKALDDILTGNAELQKSVADIIQSLKGEVPQTAQAIAGAEAKLKPVPESQGKPVTIPPELKVQLDKATASEYDKILKENNLQEKTPSVFTKIEAPAAGVQPAVKEPWQMTREEYVQLHNQRIQDLVKVQRDLSIAEKYGTPEEIRIARTNKINADVALISEMTNLAREKEVQQALAEGKPVPESVMKDYPELAKQQPVAAKPQAAVPATPAPVPVAEVKPAGEQATPEELSLTGKKVARPIALKQIEEKLTKLAKRGMIIENMLSDFNNDLVGWGFSKAEAEAITKDALRNVRQVVPVTPAKPTPSTTVGTSGEAVTPLRQVQPEKTMTVEPPIKPPKPPPTALMSLEPLPDHTPEQISESQVTGQKPLSPEQVTKTLNLFGKYIDSKSVEDAWELTRELRKETLAQKADNLKVRSQELIIGQGISPEEAMKQAIKESLSGELPVLSTDYLSDLTNKMRDVLYRQVYEKMKDTPFEMASTYTALTNALTGNPIPRERGTGSILFPKGGSAWDRLNYVFGEQPEVMTAIDKIATAKKPLQDVVEGIYRETGGPPIPPDQKIVDYINSLSDKGSQQFFGVELPTRDMFTTEPTALAGIKQVTGKTLFSPEDITSIKSLPERRSLAEMLLDFRNKDLMSNDEFLTRVKGINWLKIDSEQAIKLANELWNAEGRPGATQTWHGEKYEAPIADALKQGSLYPEPAMTSIIRILKEVGMSPVDIGGLIKAMKSSVDMSYVRQVTPLIPGHPTEFFISMVDGWKAMFSQKSAEASWVKIKNSPLYALYDAVQVESGRDFLRPLDLPKGTAQYKGTEEFGYLTKERLIPRLAEKIPWIKWSNRAFTTATNSMTIRTYEQFYKSQLRISEKFASGELKTKGFETFDIMDGMSLYARTMADWSGRAGLKVGSMDLTQAAPAIGNLVYGPRYALGRLLGPRALWSSNKWVRQQAWRDAVLFISVIGGLMVLGDRLDWWDLELDRNSADFGKGRIGNIRIDPWGGAQQFVVFFSRVFDLMTAPITGKPAMGKSSVTGAKYPLDFTNVLDNFLKSKQSPLAGLFFEYITGKTYMGEKLDVGNVKQWADRFAPMSVMDIWDAIQDKEASTMQKVSSGILTFFGVGVQDYTGDWDKNSQKFGLPKYQENLQYGINQPEYDNKDFWADTAPQFKGVDPKTLTPERGYPPKVKAIAEALSILDTIKDIPNISLSSLVKPDTKTGATFVEYYSQWKDRQVIVSGGDVAKLKDFDSKYPNASHGNMTQSQFSTLVKYAGMSDSEKVKWRNSNPKDWELINQNPYKEWMKSHSAENALLAVNGQENIYSPEALNKAWVLANSLDYPASSLKMSMDKSLPPQAIAEDYFKYQDVQEGAGSDTTKSLMEAKNDQLRFYLHPDMTPQEIADLKAKIPVLEMKVKNQPLEDEKKSYTEKGTDTYKDDLTKDVNGKTEYDRAIAKLNEDNPTWGEDLERIKAIENGGEQHADKLVELHKKLRDGKLDENSAEAKAWWLDNPDVLQFAINKYDKTGTEKWNEKVIRLDVKWRKEDGEFKALKTDEEKALYRIRNTEWNEDDRRRDLYRIQPDVNLNNENVYLGYWRLTTENQKNRYVLENNWMSTVVGRKIPLPGEVKPAEYDRIYLDNKSTFDAYFKDPNKESMRLNMPLFAKQLYRYEGLGNFVSPENLDAYVAFRVINEISNGDKNHLLPDGTVKNEYTERWFMKENPEFYKEYRTTKNWNLKDDKFEGLDFRDVPTREVYDVYVNQYQKANTLAEREDIRRSNYEFNQWGMKVKNWKPLEDETDDATVIREGYPLYQKMLKLPYGQREAFAMANPIIKRYMNLSEATRQEAMKNPVGPYDKIKTGIEKGIRR